MSSVANTSPLTMYRATRRSPTFIPTGSPSETFETGHKACQADIWNPPDQMAERRGEDYRRACSPVALARDLSPILGRRRQPAADGADVPIRHALALRTLRGLAGHKRLDFLEQLSPHANDGLVGRTQILL